MRTSRAKFEFSEAGICRALSESKPKAQVEVSANDTWTLNENKSKTQHESGNQKIRNKGNYSEPHS